MSVEKTPDKAIRCQPVIAVAHDKNGPLFDNKHVVDQCHDYIENENYFKRRCKNMERDYEKSAEKVDKAYKHLDKSIQQLVSKEDEIADKTKTITGKVRDSAQRLSDGLAKVEKQANFDRLERYVELLERAEKAMSALADLDKSGKLEKIASALK